MTSHLAGLSEEALTDTLSWPNREDVAWAGRLDEDIIVLGAGGKMGPTLVRRILRAFDQAGVDRTVYAASRYTDDDSKREIVEAGAKVIIVDLLDDQALRGLPDCPNVIFLVGTKFGAARARPRTWALNTYLPGRVANRYRDARIVALSTGNVYPQVPIHSGGCDETTDPDPLGEYAQSCLGRERIFQHFSNLHGTPICLIRLNYAVEARYGVFIDIAMKVRAGQPVALDMGYVNTIWQGDANSFCFRALEIASTPADILNVTGRQIQSIRTLAEYFGERFDVEPVFVGRERETALLSDASRCHALFGHPLVASEDIMELVASWLEQGHSTHGKPTRFEVRDGRY